MRTAVVYASLLWMAGCDRVFDVTHVPELRPDDARVDGAQVNDGAAPIDAASSCAWTSETEVISASHWTPTADGRAAVMYDASNRVLLGRVPNKTALELAPGDYVQIPFVGPSGYDSLNVPTIAADGQSMLFRMRKSSNNAYAIGRAVFMGGEWQNPVTLIMTTESDASLTLSIEDAPSAPTATPRPHFVIASPSHMFELANTGGGPNAYRVVHTYLPAELGFAFLGTGNLTGNGLDLVFAASESGDTPKLYRMTRATIDDVFSDPTLIYASASSLREPYLGADCVLTFLGTSSVFRAN